MVEFKCNKIDKKSSTPIIKDAEIDELAEMLIKDYKPAFLKEPMKIKYEHFLESYLGANLEYQHIYYGEDEKKILGVTAFGEARLKIFDKENFCTRHIVINKNSVVLDIYLVEEGREGLELFTGLHQGGHLWLHANTYLEMQKQHSIVNSSADRIRPIVCCGCSDIENFGRIQRSLVTPQALREHQADYFASAIAMPNKTFLPLVVETLKIHGITDGYVIEDAGIKEQFFAKEQLPKVIMDAYGVSKAVAYAKLRNFGFVKNTTPI